MNINLSTQSVHALKSIHASLKSAFADFQSSNGSIDKLKADLVEISAKVTAAEIEIDYTDEKALASLVIMRTQQEILEKKVPFAENVIATKPEAIVNALATLQYEIRKALEPVHKSIVEKTAESMRHAFMDDEEALLTAASHAPVTLNFESRYFRSWGEFPSSALRDYPAAIGLIEEILSGELSFELPFKKTR